MQHRHWSGDVVPSNSGRFCSVYKLQDRKGYGLTKTSLISSFSYLNLGVKFCLGGFSSDLWVPSYSVAPQLGVWRAVDAALVTHIEGVQNKVICLWIRTTWLLTSVFVMLMDILWLWCSLTIAMLWNYYYECAAWIGWGLFNAVCS